MLGEEKGISGNTVAQTLWIISSKEMRSQQKIPKKGSKSCCQGCGQGTQCQDKEHTTR